MKKSEITKIKKAIEKFEFSIDSNDSISALRDARLVFRQALIEATEEDFNWITPILTKYMNLPYDSKNLLNDILYSDSDSNLYMSVDKIEWLDNLIDNSCFDMLLKLDENTYIFNIMKTMLLLHVDNIDNKDMYLKYFKHMPEYVGLVAKMFEPYQFKKNILKINDLINKNNDRYAYLANATRYFEILNDKTFDTVAKELQFDKNVIDAYNVCREDDNLKNSIHRQLYYTEMFEPLFNFGDGLKKFDIQIFYRFIISDIQHKIIGINNTSENNISKETLIALYKIYIGIMSNLKRKTELSVTIAKTIFDRKNDRQNWTVNDAIDIFKAIIDTLSLYNSTYDYLIDTMTNYRLKRYNSGVPKYIFGVDAEYVIDLILGDIDICTSALGLQLHRVFKLKEGKA